MWTWINRGSRVLSTLMAHRAELERDYPNAIGFVDDVLAAWQRRGMSSELPRLIPVLQELTKDLES